MYASDPYLLFVYIRPLIPLISVSGKSNHNDNPLVTFNYFKDPVDLQRRVNGPTIVDYVDPEPVDFQENIDVM